MAAAVEETVREALYALQDLEYRDFQSRLIPNIDRRPHARAAEICKTIRKNKRGGSVYADAAPCLL